MRSISLYIKNSKMFEKYSINLISACFCVSQTLKLFNKVFATFNKINLFASRLRCYRQQNCIQGKNIFIFFSKTCFIRWRMKSAENIKLCKFCLQNIPTSFPFSYYFILFFSSFCNNPRFTESAIFFSSFIAGKCGMRAKKAQKQHNILMNITSFLYKLFNNKKWSWRAFGRL